MEDKKIKKIINEIYNVFDKWTDLGAEDNDITVLKKQIERVIKDNIK